MPFFVLAQPAIVLPTTQLL